MNGRGATGRAILSGNPTKGPTPPMVTRHPAEVEDDAASARELMDTVIALRGALEAAASERQEAIQTAVQAAVDEVEQLRATISELRAELEALAAAHTDELAAQARAFRDERDQLMATITELRSQLEAGRG